MKPRLIAAIVSFGLAPMGHTSDALGVLAPVLCNATHFYDATMRQCGAHFPDLSTRAAAAYSRWVKVNGEGARKLEKACNARLSKVVAKAATKELDAAERKTAFDKMAQAKERLIAEIPLHIQKKGKEFCATAIATLESKEMDSEFAETVREFETNAQSF